MSAKSKSAVPGTPNAKSSPATPRVTRGVVKPGADSPSSLQNGRSSVEQSPRISKGVIKPSGDSVSSLQNGRNSIGVSRGVSKLSGDSVSPLQNGRASVDRSPGSVTSKLKPSRLSAVLNSPTDRKTTVQAELSQAQEELKKVNEKLVLLEKEKAETLDEAKKARVSCDEANEKLEEAFLAQKRAEENSEIEKFRALEVEQVGSEAKEDELRKELEAVRNQHIVDMAALVSATEELQKVKQELAMTSAAKNQALSHADDATKIAEIHSEKVEFLSAEVVCLRSNVEMQAVEENKLVLEIYSVKQELERVKNFEDEKVENLIVDLEATKMAEFYAFNLVKEMHQRVEELAFEAEEGRESEKLASESLRTVRKNLEETNDLLNDARSEIMILKEKLGSFEILSEKQRSDLEESERRLEQAKLEASEMAKKIMFIESELETARKERSEALNNESLASASLQSLLEEKNKLVNELETSKDEEEKSKKALESLTSALHEVSAEARDAKEKLISSQDEHDNYERQIEDLISALNSTNEKYESMLDNSNKQITALTDSIEQLRHDCGSLKDELEEKELALSSSVRKFEEENSLKENEMSRLSNSLGQSKHDYDNLKAEMEQKELDFINSVNKSEEENQHLESEKSSLIESLEESKQNYDNLKAELEQKEEDMINSVKKSEEEKSQMENEINRLLNLLKFAEEASSAMKDERDCSNKSLNEADSEVIYLKQVVGEAKEESSKLKEGLTEMEKKMQKIVAENEELRRRAKSSQEKVEELSKLLEESESKHEDEESGDLTDCEKDYDMLPRVVEFSEQNGKEKPASADRTSEVENSKEKDEAKEESTNADLKMWESCKIDVKDFSPERESEHESFEEGESSDLDHANVVSKSNGSPPGKSSSEKKKKPLLHKFGSLLKKKSSSSQKP